ncbi:PucR family transcriptional regulator ligand-binding domain-containing protein [Micromonospora sp. NBC_01655]|uniref:PucR family transcriptional regulator n=1 Tax=Micromonospora sp. NBC_01655 TaxID=2975983 RepID=UPI0022540EE9|nr:PucR family transcriptional regulator [Micromonospora sp. NBC_01655]MCX4471569.1 PucR family transcriptional regulator ligand-binding domain-containing protein [Micromonospora sp. NBC_01655]
MPVTLDALLAHPDLGLRMLTSPGPEGAALQVPIRWAATSELDDPTPYLQGGELLLTTGLRLPPDRAGVNAYLGRLLDADVVALGYGVGLVTDTVPALLVHVARERGLPLIEVDQPTPFIAISKAVSDLLTAERYAEVERGFAGQQALTRAAVTGHAPGVVSRLAATLGGWAALLSPGGKIRHVSPAGARPCAAGLADEVGRLRGRRHAALSLVHGTSHVVVHPLSPATAGHAPGRGFLAVGMDRPLGATDQSLINVATALLSFDLEQTKVGEVTARSAALLRLLLDGGQPDEEILVGLGAALLTNERLHVTALTGPPDVLDELLLDLIARLDDHVFAAVVGGDLLAVTADQRDQDILLARIPDDGRVAAGTSVGSSAAGLAQAIHQARQAAATARHLMPPVLDYSQVRRTSAVGLVDLPALSAYADSLLGPLDEYARATGIDLVGSLAAWLGQHGQYDPAAASLRIHRHTLRYRVQKAAALLGRDLSSVDARMELWFAITARQRTLSTPTK